MVTRGGRKFYLYLRGTRLADLPNASRYALRESPQVFSGLARPLMAFNAQNIPIGLIEELLRSTQVDVADLGCSPHRPMTKMDRAE